MHQIDELVLSRQIITNMVVMLCIENRPYEPDNILPEEKHDKSWF